MSVSCNRGGSASLVVFTTTKEAAPPGTVSVFLPYFFDLFDFPIVNSNNVLCKCYRINCKTHVQVSAKCYNKYNVLQQMLQQIQREMK